MHFDSDYTGTCHPLILRRMAETLGHAFGGYGTDTLTLFARQKIRALCQRPEAAVYFLCGGTQTNQVVIDFLLRSFEGVLAADTGHISIHESGAIEATGHKVLTLPLPEPKETRSDLLCKSRLRGGGGSLAPLPEGGCRLRLRGGSLGKITAAQIDEYVRNYYADPNWEHIVPPGMVYITHPTEYGTLYSLRELEAISAVCRTHKIPLYLDGARLGYALAAEDTDISLPDIARLCDAFYIGGTKCGAMFGEAVVFPDGKRADRFFSHIKRHGALLAKGWVAALQFNTLLEGDTFTDTPYYKICRHAIREAMRLKQALLAKGYTQPVDSPTNQQFIEISLKQAEELKKHVIYGEWEPPRGDRVTVRLATSWATDPKDVDELIELL